MSRSKQEEIAGTLWLISALLAFANGYQIWGYLFAAKAAFDMVISVALAISKIAGRVAYIKNYGK